MHGLVSRNTMLITFKGRESQKLYTVPVNYVRDGDVFLVTSYRHRKWWRNLANSAPVKLLVQRQDLSGIGEVITDDKDVADNLMIYLKNVPKQAKYFGVGLDSDGKPILSDVVRAVKERVVVRIQLKHHELAQLGKIDSVGFREILNTPLLKTAIRAWLMEILVSGFNFFVLMNLIYEPKWGSLAAHQIGMSTRIVYIFVFAYFLLRYVKEYETKDLIHVGTLWLGLTLMFEWVGSFAIGRPVGEILIGWNIFAGYMWPYVLLTYLLSNLIVGTIFHPGKKP
ncbi:MAG: nitroreductase/quinone reductase family protein [Candidatus Bathyarchaeia archaeon]